VAATSLPAVDKPIQTKVAVPDPTAVLAFDTQKILTRSQAGEIASLEGGQWPDNLPKLMQARIVQSFENANLTASVSRPLDDLNADYRLAVEIRRFEIALGQTPTAVVEFAARLIGKNDNVQAQLFKASVPIKSTDVPDAVNGLREAFAQTARELVGWVVGQI
jgi:ABC-type uncharacterized transport system auxiliary subunit